MKKSPTPTLPPRPVAKPAPPRRRTRPEQRAHILEKTHSPMVSELRRRAESVLRKQQKQPPLRPADTTPKALSDPQRTRHELEVHQIELEMQKEELQEARNRLETQLEKYTDLYDFAPVAYITLDEQGVILEVNLTGAELLHLERSRLLNKRCLRFVAASSHPTFLDFLEKVFAQPGQQDCEVSLQTEHATPFWARLRAVAMVAAAGARRCCRLSIWDITARKQVEEILRRNEAFFTALIQQAPVGVYVVDDQLRLQQVNPTAQPTFSKIQPLLGQDLAPVMHRLWPRQTADKILQHFRHTLQTGEPHITTDFTEQRRDTGVTESYEGQIQRLQLPAGGFGVVCFFNNITERKRAGAALHRVEVLAASNEKLAAEIVRRQGGEAALKDSEQQLSHSLAQAQEWQRELRGLSHKLLRAQEDERKRISRDLHDEIIQTLVGINLQLVTLAREAAANPAVLPEKLARTQQLVADAVDRVHRFARDLRPSVLDDLGLIPALAAHCKEFASRTKIRVRFTRWPARNP